MEVSGDQKLYGMFDSYVQLKNKTNKNNRFGINVHELNCIKCVIFCNSKKSSQLCCYVGKR